MVYGSRIEQARKLSGYTQIQLAKKIGVDQSTIAQYEKGRNTPTEEIIKAIADATGFLPGFFTLEPIEDFPKGSLSYRALKTVTAKEEDKAYYNAKLMFEHLCRISRTFRIPRMQLPQLNTKPEQAAEIVRSSLGIAPDAPIKNLTHLLEKNGVIVLSLPIFLEKIDAFSIWTELQGNRPMIAQSFGKPGDRLRFSLAHEVGHLVMHYPPKPTVSMTEKEASEFASAFLLPKEAIIGDLIPPVTLYLLAQLKKKWGVSMHAITYRARTLEVVTERQATYLFTQMASHGWQTQEPSNLDVRIETPQLFRKMIEGSYKDVESYSKAMQIGEARASEMILFA